MVSAGCLKTERSSVFVFGEYEGYKQRGTVTASEGKEGGLISRRLPQKGEKLSRISGETPELPQKIHREVPPTLATEHMLLHLLHHNANSVTFPFSFAAPLTRTAFGW